MYSGPCCQSPLSRYVYLSVCVFVYLSVCVFVYLSICVLCICVSNIPTVDLAVSPLCQDNVNFVDFMGRPLYQPRRPSIKPHKVPAIFAQYLSGPILLVNITLAFKRVGSEMTLGGPW